MSRAISYFIFSSNGAYLRWDDDSSIGFIIRTYPMSITGGSGIDRLYAGAGTQVDATGLFASAGIDQLYFSGNFADYTQTVSSNGIYTFTGMAGGSHAGEVISFSMTSSGDSLVFADTAGIVKLGTYLNTQTNTFATILSSQLTAATQPIPALGAVPGNAASKVFVFDSGGIHIPQLPIVGEAIAITGGSGADSFYVRKGTNADATGLFASAGIDTLYLTGRFADYTQTVSGGGVYTFTRNFTAAADAGLSEVVSFSITSSGDTLVFADGGLALHLGHYLSGGTFAAILATELSSHLTTGAVTLPLARLVLMNDTGSSANDGITNNPTINVLGLVQGATWQYQVDDSSWQTGTGTSFTASNGAHEYAVVLTERAITGNANFFAFTLDTTPPVPPSLSLASDTGNNHDDGITTNPTINVSGLESGATWQYQVDSNAWQTGTGASFTASMGRHSYAARQTDVAGNTGNVGPTATYTLDIITPAPTLSLASDTGSNHSDGITNNPTVNVTGLVSGDSWQYQVDSNSWQTGTGTSFTASTGTHSYAVRQIDVTGNISMTSTAVTYTLDTLAPTGIAIVGITGNVAENSLGAVTLTANANDLNTNASVTWALGTGGDTALFNLNNGVLSFKNAPNYEMPRGQIPNIENSNAYTVNVIASDLAGNASTQTLVVNVTNVNEAPTAIQLSSNILVENTSVNNGIKVGDLLVIDPDSTSLNRLYRLIREDAGDFVIRNGTELFYTGTTPSYATQSSYNITIHSIDRDLLRYSQNLNIKVASLNNPQLIGVRNADTGNVPGSTSDTFILTFDQAVQVSQIQQAFADGNLRIVHSDGTTSDPGQGATLQATYPSTITTSNFKSIAGDLVAEANTTFTSLWNSATQKNDLPNGLSFLYFRQYGIDFVLDTSVPVYQASSGYYLWKPLDRLTYILSKPTPFSGGNTPLPWWIGDDVVGFGTATTPREGVLISGNWFVNNGYSNIWESAFTHPLSLSDLPQLSASGLSSQFTLALGTGRTVNASDHIEIATSAVISSTGVAASNANSLQSVNLPGDISRPSVGSATIKGMTSDANGHWQNSHNTLQVGDLIRVEVALNEAVSIVYNNFDTTISEVTLQIGKVTRQAKLNLQASQNTNLLVFDYTVANGDIDNSAGVKVSAMAPNWCVYKDASGNRIAFPELLLGTSNNLVVNGGSSLLSQQPISTQGVIANEDANTPYKWPASVANSAVTTVTYYFITSAVAPHFLTEEATPTFRPWSDAQKTVLRQIIANLEEMTMLSFVEVTDPTQAQIALGALDSGPEVGAFAEYPSIAGDVNTRDGDIWVNTAVQGWNQPSTDLNGMSNFARSIIFHELGHALGLQHPRNYNAGGVALPGANAASTPAPFYGYYLDAEQDNEHFTVLSYNLSPHSSYFSLNYALYDVAALQFLYGTNTSTRNGDNHYTLNTSTGTLMADGTALPTTCIWDGGGNDTLSLATSTSSTSAVLNLNQGAFSSVGSYAEFVIAYGVDIENAIGGLGADILVSNTLDNQLTGGGGADKFVFLPEWGHDIITDFTLNEDHIDFSRWLGIRFADLSISQSNLNTLITYQSNSITLNNILSAQLIAGAFVFA